MKSIAPHLEEQLVDIQAILGSGFGWLKNSQFLLLTIRDAALARRWIEVLRSSGLLVSIADLNSHGENLKEEVHAAAAIAFSFEGLALLGISETEDAPFPTPFRSAMGSGLRKTLLRDAPRDDWRWSDSREDRIASVHVLVMNWWDANSATAMNHPDPAAFETITVDGCPSFFPPTGMTEPFGFRDGVGQPVMFGLRVASESSPAPAAGVVPPRDTDRDDVIAPGEFILGYRNEYDELTYTADVRRGRERFSASSKGTRFSLNGSFLAVRQIEQDVRGFKDWWTATGLASAEKLMGRCRDDEGTPLGWPALNGPMPASSADAFRYRVDDAEGFMCPRGAHVRRVHPRDSLGHDLASSIRSSKLHRLLRRGRPYRASADDRPTQGIMFIALNADLERQFEFIYQRWLQNPRFAKLDGENDPVVGNGRSPKVLSIPGLPAGESISLSSFTTTLGGGYFFLPGLKALEFIAPNVAAHSQIVTTASAMDVARSTGGR